MGKFLEILHVFHFLLWLIMIMDWGLFSLVMFGYIMEAFGFGKGPKSALIHTPEVTVVQVQRRGVGEWGWQGNMIFNASIKWYAVLFVRLALPFSLAFWCWILTWEVWYVKTLLKESNKGICLRVIAAPFHVLIGGSWCRHQFLIKKVTINHYYI